MAEIAAIRRHRRLVPVKRRMQVGEIRGNGLGGQAPRNNPRGHRVRHGWLPGQKVSGFLGMQTATAGNFIKR